jgi:hypothetical protein
MSIWTNQEIACEACGARFRGRVVSGLNLTRNPDVRQAILDEKLHVFECPQCGARVLLDRTFLYTDLERRHFLGVFPRGRERGFRNAERDVEELYRVNIVDEPSGILFGGEDPRFEVRAVFGYGRLREKLVAWDAGLDDRLVEVLKMHLLRERRELDGFLDLRLDAVAGPAGPLSLLALRDDGPERLRIDAPLEAYRALEAQRDTYANTYPDLFGLAFADLRRYLLGDAAA